MENNYFITTPIYYVNASPHIGHAYTTIVADVLSRHYRLAGYRTFFLTGTDEHGDKIVEAAKNAGKAPKDFVDQISAQFRNLWPELNITNDYFVRTTDSKHVETVRTILQKVYESGDIYFGNYEGYYCVGCERFYTEKELIEGLCPDHRAAPEYRKESNYFFRMSKYQDWLIGYINDNPDFIRPERYKNEVLSFLKEPLEDLCISRPKSRLQWGISLPFDDNFVTYVWFDALINYISALDYPNGDNFKIFWPYAQHLIAKDILKPHGIYWPTMLKAAGIEPYRHLNVHGYWIIDQSKISKSLGNVVKPLELKNTYGVDSFRYFLLRDMVFGLDSSFSEESFVQRVNADLANDLGNLVSRVITMAFKYCEGKVPEPHSPIFDGRVLVEAANGVISEVENSFKELALHRSLICIWEFISIVNKYVVEREPWHLAKDPANKIRLDTIIYNLLESLRVIAVLISPFMPTSSKKIMAQIGIEDTASQNYESIRKWAKLPFGISLKQADSLFPRIKHKREESASDSGSDGILSIKADINFEDFEKIDLRVATIVKAEAIPKSAKLVKLLIDIGEKRTIVAGIGKDYALSDLIGKRIVVVANIKPTKIMGVESRGMLLAAETEGGLKLLTLDGNPKPGSSIR